MHSPVKNNRQIGHAEKLRKILFAPKALQMQGVTDAKSAFLSFCHRIPNAAAHVLLPPPQHNSGRGHISPVPTPERRLLSAEKADQQLRNYTLHGGHTEVWLRVPGIGACSAVSGRFCIRTGHLCAPLRRSARRFPIRFCSAANTKPESTGSIEKSLQSKWLRPFRSTALHTEASEFAAPSLFCAATHAKRQTHPSCCNCALSTQKKIAAYNFYAPARKGLSCGEPSWSVFTEKPFIRPLQVNCPKSNRALQKISGPFQKRKHRLQI